MEEKQGNIKISSENMMPIIKKWLYSDKDIFLREIVANGVDAVTKFKKLVEMGEAQAAEGEEYRINVFVDEKAKTLTVEDNGAGMSEARLKQLTEKCREQGSLCLEKEETDSIGLLNVNFRLKNYYGEEYGLILESEEGRGTKITIRIPESEKKS